MSENTEDIDKEALDESPRSASYLKHALRGSTWSLGQSVAAKITGLIAQIILTRLLFPSDFALIGVALGLLATFSFVSPLSQSDLLVQRGARFPNAVINTRRLVLLGGLVVTILVLGLSPLLAHKDGERIQAREGGSITASSPLSSIDSTPSIEELFEQRKSVVVLEVDDTSFKVPLPDLPSDATIANYGDALQKEIRLVTGDQDFEVRFDSEEQRLSIRSESDRSFRVIVETTTAGAILDTLGFSYVSIPLMIILGLLTLRIIFEAIGLPYLSWIRKEMRFGTLAVLNFSTSLTAQTLAILIAALFQSPIALLMVIIVPPILKAVAGYFLVRPMEVSPPSEREPMKNIAADSYTLWTANWIHAVGLQTPTLILSLFLSSSEVGFYFWASTQASQMGQIMLGMTASVLTPIFSTLQEQPDRLAEAFMRTARLSAATLVPIFYSIAAISPLLVPLVFGENWSFAVPILLVLLVERSFSSGTPISGALLKGSGRYRAWLCWQAAYSVIILGLAALVVWQFGMFGFVVANCITSAISVIVGYKICLGNHVRWSQLLGIYVLPILGSLPLLGVAACSFWLETTWFNLILTAPSLILVSLGLYLLIIRSGDPRLFQELTKITRHFMPSRKN